MSERAPQEGSSIGTPEEFFAESAVTQELRRHFGQAEADFPDDLSPLEQPFFAEKGINGADVIREDLS